MKNVRKRLLSALLALSLLASLTVSAAAAETQTVFQGIDTLMIYNPMTDHKRTMSTGNMTGQVGSSRSNVFRDSGDRASLSGLDEPGNGFYFSDQDILLDELTQAAETNLEDLLPAVATETTEKTETPAEAWETDSPALMDLDGSGRAAGYAVGSRRSFHYQPGSRYTGASASFTCLYAGDSCYIWGYGFSNQAIANAMGAAFDATIFRNDTNAYGTARYIQDGGKLNILIYPMSRTGLCGFFRPLELLTAAEMNAMQSGLAQAYNHDEAVIHINTSVCTAQRYETYGLVTLAHEYQHLICFSSSLLGRGGQERMMGTWLNEAMSMQAEEISYPGEVVRARYISSDYNNSGDIASGQSLYNFATENDIGVYGQAFMFSEYLKKQSGTGAVFKRLHDHWRQQSAENLTDAKALYSVLSSVRGQVNGIASYPASLGLSTEEAFLSKLDLAFQIGTVVKNGSGAYSLGSACAEADPKLFTGTRGSIEGGGRILIATKDANSYTVPNGADPRLIYVGFKDGKMVIAPTTAADYAQPPAPHYTVTATVNDAKLGSVSVEDHMITVSVVGNAGFADPAYTVVSGSATVARKGHILTVTPGSDCVIRVNLEAKSPAGGVDVWDGTVADALPYGRTRNEYVIYTGAQLAKLAQMVNAGESFEGKDICLAADLDLSGHQWTPIGLSTYRPFKGSFFGYDFTAPNGIVYHTISGVTIGSPDAPAQLSCAGLFGKCGSGGTVQYVTLRDVAVYNKGASSMTGGLVGDGQSATNCTVTGTVSGLGNTGMICGRAVSLQNCTGIGQVQGGSSVGGLLGQGEKVEQCGFMGTVSGESNVGGIVGSNNSNNIVRSCYSVSDVSGGRNVGGLVGSTYLGSLGRSYWAGTISGSQNVGGIAGSYGAPLYGAAWTGDYCYYDNTTVQTGLGDSLVSDHSEPRTRAELKDAAKFGSDGYDFSTVWKIDPDLNDGYPIFRWQNAATLAQVSLSAPNHTVDVGKTLQLAVKLQPAQSYTLTSSDATVATVDQNGLVTGVGEGECVITLRTEGGLTAYLRVQVRDMSDLAAGFAGGSGTEEDPYLVSTPSNLFHLANLTNSGYSFKGEYIYQTADIRLNGSAENPWVPIGSTRSTPFSGHYDGGGRVIEGLYMTSGEIQGLFGAVKGAEVAMLSIDHSTFQGGTYAGAFAGYATDCAFVDLNTLDAVAVVSGSASASRVGGVVGIQTTTSAATNAQIGFCSNAGRVDSTATPDTLSTDSGTGTGGIVGYLTGDGTARTAVVACRNEGTITGNVGDDCGGIVGVVERSYILNSYNTGKITSKGFAGGIAGESSGAQTSFCYNAGALHGVLYGRAGGIVGHGIGGGLLICYSWGQITAEAADDYTAGIISWKESGITVSNCIYLQGSVQYPQSVDTEGALCVSASSLKDRAYLLNSFCPADYYDDTWDILPDVNGGYPVLKSFHPSWNHEVAALYDRAHGAPRNGDASAYFHVYTNILEGLRNGERNDRDLTDGDAGVGSADVPEAFYEIENPASGENSAVMTIRQAYLDTLSVGTHTLTARFGANVNVDFDVIVQDTPPDTLALRAVEAPVEDGILQPTFSISVPAGETQTGKLLLASYRNGQMTALAVRDVTLAPGRNDVTVSMSYDASADKKVFLLDEAGRPLLSARSFRTPEELLGATTMEKERTVETPRGTLLRAVETMARQMAAVN